MTIAFRRPAGAIADVNELEYISALHQTDLTEVREDGSIDANDIRLFLLSRYGIEVTDGEVQTKIIRGLGGGNEETDDTLDLMEVVAMLTIPTLRKAAASNDGDDELTEGLIKPRAGLIDFVLQMMLHDCTGASSSSNEPKKLTKTLIKRLLRSYDEHELAENDEVIEEMLLAASTGDETSEGFFDGTMFARALTQDVQMYSLANEVRLSTIHDDVFLTKNKAETEEWDEQEEGISRVVVMERRKLGEELKKRRFTFSAIDTTAGTYRSKALVVMLWASFTLTYFTYYHSELQNSTNGSCDEFPYVYGASWDSQSDAIGCSVAISILRWLIIFAFITVYGLGFIGLSSIGNYVGCRRWWVPLIGALFAGGAVWTPFQEFGSATYLGVATLLLGVGVVIFHVSHSLSMLVPKHWKEKNPRLKRHLTTGTVMSEVHVKQAAAHKVNEMIKNALDIAENKSQEGVLVSHFGQGLLKFSKSDKHESAGGVGWTWRSIYNGELLNREGIWLSARLLSSNIAQFLVSTFILTAGISLTKETSVKYDEENARDVAGEYVNLIFDRTIDAGLTEELVSNITTQFSSFLSSVNPTDAFGAQCNASIGFGDLSSLGESACSVAGDFYNCSSVTSTDYLCTLAEQAAGNGTLPAGLEDGLLNLGLLNASGLNVDLILEATKQALVTAAESSVDSLYPAEKSMVVVPMAVAVVIAFIAAITLAVTYIPSATATTLKLRNGVIPTLRDPNFHKYRIAADQVTVLLGSLFWGCFIAAILVGGFFGLILFVFMWQATKALVQRFLAWLIGLVVVILIKLVMVQCCRCACYRAFYRRRPLSANIASLALECANFALSVGFVLVRMLKLLFTAILCVGRIDSFFLAPGVGELRLGKVDFRIDNYPFIFMKDILIHEAHRHPYIELLGCMYLLKLRYGNHFGNRGGSTWRLLFVYALMPWMHKYRLACRSNGDEHESSIDRRPSTSKKLRCLDLHHGYEFNEASEHLIPRRQSMLLSQAMPVSMMNLVEQDTQLQMRVEELVDDNKELKERVARLQAMLGESQNPMLEESRVTTVDNSLDSDSEVGGSFRT